MIPTKAEAIEVLAHHHQRRTLRGDLGARSDGDAEIGGDIGDHRRRVRREFRFLRDQRRIDDRTSLEHQSAALKNLVDGGQDRIAQMVLLQQVPEAKNGALVEQIVLSCVQTHELAEQRHVVQRFLHRRVREVEPLLQEVNA
jgi:hypothetical protein